MMKLHDMENEMYATGSETPVLTFLPLSVSVKVAWTVAHGLAVTNILICLCWGTSAGSDCLCCALLEAVLTSALSASAHQ